MPRRHASLIAAVAVVSLAAAGPARAAFDIVINNDGTLTPAAVIAFNRAAAQWESRFTDNVTITFASGLGPLGSSTIGGASPLLLTTDYTTVRNAVVADAANEASNGIVAFLPATPNFTTASGVSYSGGLTATKANLKALGVTGLDATYGVNDATITFSNSFNFDFDNTDGVTAGSIDFESVAVHEIGHALGFVSTIDFNGAATSVSASTLDLFRFANNVAGQDPSTAAEFSAFPRNLVPGTASVFDDTANEYAFSNGVSNQASHWLNDGSPNGGPLNANYIGVMDPTIPSGVISPITAADVRAFDLIGYDVVVPEPTTLAALGGIAIVGLRRRRGVVA